MMIARYAQDLLDLYACFCVDYGKTWLLGGFM